MGDRVDPEARRRAGRQREVETLVIVGNVFDDRLQRVGHHLQAHALGLAHLDDDIVAVGQIVLHVADHVRQAMDFFFLRSLDFAHDQLPTRTDRVNRTLAQFFGM